MMFYDVRGCLGEGGGRGQGIVSVRNSGQYCTFRVSHFTLYTVSALFEDIVINVLNIL